MKLFRSILSIILITSLLSGCGTNVLRYTNDTAISDTQYANILEAELKVTRNKSREIKYNLINLYEVPDEYKERLLGRTKQELDNLLLKIGYYGIDSENNYLNYTLDPWYADNKDFRYSFYNNASNYYVKVDITGLNKNPAIADFKKPANYVGIYGAINYDENGNMVVDELYLKTLVDTINTYRTLNGLDALDDEIEQINYIQDYDEDFIFSSAYQEVIISTDSEITEDLSEQYELDQQNENIIKEIQDDEAIAENQKDVWNRVIRKLAYNAKDFNDIVGITKDYFSTIPSPLALFSLKEVHPVQGYNLYDWGSTLKEVSRNKSKANVSIVFIFQKNAYSDDFDFLTYYIDNIKTIDIAQDGTVEFISNFVSKNIDIVIEDFNRAYSNKDITRLTSGDLISPQDLGIYWLLQRDSVSFVKGDFWLNKLLRKEGNTYLCLVNQMSDEICKGVEGTTGRYYRTWYMRIGLEDSKFKILDMYPCSLNVLRIPDIPIQTGEQEKLNSLQRQDIKDYVDDKIKETIREEMKKLEIALTYKFDRDLSVNDKILVDDNDIPHYGVSSRFSQDKTILKSNDLTNIAEILAHKVTKHGNVKCEVHIVPSIWIQGSNDQVELISNVLFIYGDKQFADILNVYMIYNKFNNVWTIDQFNILDEQEIDSKNDIQTLYDKYVGGEEKNDSKKKSKK